MPQNPRYGRSRYDWDDERDRGYGGYGRGRDDWRDQSRAYRSSQYQDEGDHDQRQDRDYQGTLRAGDYGRYEEEEGRSYPERFQSSGRRGSGRGYGESSYGGRYGSEDYGDYSRSGSQSYGGSGGGGRSRDYSGQDYSSSYRGRDYGSSSGGRRDYGGGGYGSYGGYTGSGGSYGQGGDAESGFGSYVSDYDRRYGGGYGSNRDYGGQSQRDYGRNRDWWDRATDEVSSWFGDKDAERRRRMDEHRGRGPKNYSRSDDRIREDVSDRLTDDPLVDASEIDVSVSGQEVTLSGTVHTRRQKRLAEECAESVSGVKHVQNNLRVKEPSWSTDQSGTSGSGTGGSKTFGSGGTTTM